VIFAAHRNPYSKGIKPVERWILADHPLSAIRALAGAVLAGFFRALKHAQNNYRPMRSESP
jgi:hypothetical protein